MPRMSENAEGSDDERSEIAVAHAAETAMTVWPEFRVVKDLVFFARDAPDEANYEPPADRTAAESFTNHTHIFDRFAHGAGLEEEPFYDAAHPDFAAACRFGKRWAHAVAMKLWFEFPGRSFFVYYTESDNPIVRFHQQHAGEPPWLDPQDWAEAIARGEVVVWEVRGRDPAFLPVRPVDGQGASTVPAPQPAKASAPKGPPPAPASPTLTCDLFKYAASWRPAGPVHIVGFDSAWTLTNTGALAVVRATSEGLALTVPPAPCTFDRARDLIAELRATGPVVIAIDQPLVVPNASSLRPVDRVAGSPIGKRGGGVQPANTSRADMFGAGAPIWKFLREVAPTSIDPRVRPSGPGDVWVLEVFPALASVGLFPQVQSGKLLKYNPVQRKTFRPGDWAALTRVLAGIADDLGIPALAAWAERLESAKPTKRLQDELDAVLCVLIGLLIQFAPANTCIVGDALTGYIVTPCPPTLAPELQAAAARAGVAYTPG